MTKILFQSVGTGGDEYPVWEALAECAKQFTPDLLIQWCSEKTASETVPKFQQQFSGEPGFERSEQVCHNPDDVEALMLEYARQIDAIRKQYPEAELAVDYTSGTKAMSAAAVAAAVSRQVPVLYYGVGNRDETGRARATERHVETRTDQLIAEPLLNELGRLFDLGQFTAVREQVTHLQNNLLGTGSDPVLLARAETLKFWAEVYDFWDRFNWKKSFAIIRDTSQNLHEMLSLTGWTVDRFDAQCKHIKKCKAADFKSPHRLADLLANVSRRIDAGAFDDAVSRLYRAIEFIVQSRIAGLLDRKKEANPTSGIDWKRLTDTFPQTVDKNKIECNQKGKANLGQHLCRQALLEVDDPVGMRLEVLNNHKFRDQDPTAGRLKELLNRRNNSWLAHGSVPVTEGDACEMYEIVLEVARRHASLEDFDLEDQLQIATFQKCPWETMT